MPDFDPLIRQDAARWLARKMNQSAWTSGNEREFQTWLAASPAHRKEFSEMEQIYHSMEVRELFSKEEIRENLRHSSPSGRRLKFSAAITAAAALVILGLFFAFSGTTYQTGVGELHEVSLPDGTRAHLDAGTRLVCRFSGKQRIAKLTSGGAVFTVAGHDPRPFEIRTASAVIRDIGTTFDVHVREDQIGISVEEGIVEIRNPRAGHAARRITAGQTLSWDGNGDIPPPSENLFKFGAWREGRVYYNEQPLSAVLEDFRRYVPKPIRLADPSLGELKVSGALRPANHRQALEVLSEILPIRFHENTEAILIERRHP
ncbi:MAG: FecR domain-containing protein [Luteolibacter sp.]